MTDLGNMGAQIAHDPGGAARLIVSLRVENERLRRGARELSVAAYACGAPGIGAQLRELAGASDEEVNDG